MANSKTTSRPSAPVRKDARLDEAARLPVAFAQVREDSLIDLDVVRRVDRPARIAMVASGGCTAAALVAEEPALLHLVDPNPAQLHLSQLKLHLLLNADPQKRLVILGHSPLANERRRDLLEEAFVKLDLPEDALGPLERVSQLGPDFAGRYEQLFVWLQEDLLPHCEELHALLQLSDTREQTRRVDRSTRLGSALDEAYRRIFDLDVLIPLFGEGATRNRVEPFADHFLRRTRHALTTLPAVNNPYLWQLLRGQYPPGRVIPWLRLPRVTRLPKITSTNSPMAAALAEAPNSFDMVHLSNILDWLSPDEARETLKLAWKSLRPGGWVVVRQLNSTLDIAQLGEFFAWSDDAAAWHAQDRSFFYRALFVGQKV
jgi:S-adenosylmethionine-diacylglycerol 3-amino-3-carboxypropyl transferase